MAIQLIAYAAAFSLGALSQWLVTKRAFKKEKAYAVIK